MKLTVGSLPSAVYWRRRVVLLGGVLVAIVVLYAACSGGDDSGGKRKAAATGSNTPDPSKSLLTPTTEGPSSPAPVKTETPTSPPASPAAPSATCGDDEIAVTAVPANATLARGGETTIQLKVKNISARSCSRDLGADAQELYLLDGSGSAKMWSSDACDALRGTSVRTLAPGSEQVFQAQWNGKTTSGGCDAQTVPAAGQYQLMARLGTKFSAAVTVTLA